MRPALLLAVAFATGGAVMIVEIMGVRLMAPWFGQSQVVWTNVIGIVLASLAAGQWLGGRWAESPRGIGPSSLVLFAGGVCVGLPELVGTLSAVVLPDALTLGEAYGFVSLGSLFTTIVTLGPPMLALGAVAPWLVRLTRDAPTAPGRAAGRVLGAGTLGSLAGTFGATHVLLEWIGSAGSVRLAGVVLIVVGVILGSWRRIWRAGAPAAAVVGAALMLRPAESASGVVLEERETLYQYARVVETDGLRLLKLNEGLDSFHSAWRPGLTTTGLYFDAFVLPSLLAPLEADGRRRILILGFGGGTMARLLAETGEAFEVVGVEIDGDLPELGHRWLGFEPDMARVVTMDGRVALRADSGGWGAILVDAYAQQIYVPPHLASEEFFALVHARLRPGGVMAFNLGGVTREDPLVSSVAAAVHVAFEAVEMARIPGSRNWIVLAFKGVPASIEERRRVLAPTPFSEALAWMADGTMFAEAPEVGELRIVDGHAPVEALSHRAWSSW